MSELKTCRIRIRKDYDTAFRGYSSDKRKSVLAVIYPETAKLDYICVKKRGKPHFVIFSLDDYGFFYFNTFL